MIPQEHSTGGVFRSMTRERWKIPLLRHFWSPHWVSQEVISRQKISLLGYSVHLFFLSTSPREISCSSLKPQSSWSISRFFGLRASFMEYAQLIDFVVGRVVNCRNIHIEFFFNIYINSRAGEKPARSCPSWMPIFQSPRKCLHNFITFGTWRMFDLFFHLITYINCYR